MSTDHQHRQTTPAIEPVTHELDLVFDPDEHGSQVESLRLRLAALDQLDPDERASIGALIEGALLRHRARRLAQTS